MALKPNITFDFSFKNCESCGRALDSLSFLKTKSYLFPSGYINICTDCLARELEQNNYSWNAMDHLCQYLDIPFIPDKYEEILVTTKGADMLRAYNTIFFTEQYDGIDWGSYEEAYKDLQDSNALSEAVPLLAEQERIKLQQKWGLNYDDEALHYLENLYDGMTLTQNINGALQIDQALKICKVSYEIDCCLREGKDIDKLLASYDKLVKTGEFTPKNVKNASDFESMGELVRWLEKKGFENQFYDGETRDVVDETIKNIQSWNQRLYTNESGIGDEITQRIQSLKTAAELENYYDIDPKLDYDDYENEGFNQLMKDDEFAADLEGEGL